MKINDLFRVFIILGVAALVTVAIQLLFKIRAPFSLLEAEWTAGEYLTYIAGTLTFAGTYLLGIHTLESANKYQEIANGLAKNNNELQAILAQNMLPIFNIKAVNLFPAGREARIKEEVLECSKTFSIGRRYTKEGLKALINLNIDVAETFCNLKIIRFNLENTSQVPIRHVAIERIVIHRYDGNYSEVTCNNKYGEKSGLSVALSPNQQLEVEVSIYYLDKVYEMAWESESRGLSMTLFLENTSFAGKKFKQRIVLSATNGGLWDVKFGDDGWSRN